MMFISNSSIAAKKAYLYLLILACGDLYIFWQKYIKKNGFPFFFAFL